MDFVEWESQDGVPPALSNRLSSPSFVEVEPRAHILARLTPSVVEFMWMGQGITGGISEV